MTPGWDGATTTVSIAGVGRRIVIGGTWNTTIRLVVGCVAAIITSADNLRCVGLAFSKAAIGYSACDPTLGGHPGPALNAAQAAGNRPQTQHS